MSSRPDYSFFSPCSCRALRPISRNADEYDRSLSVTTMLGAKPCFLSSPAHELPGRRLVPPPLHQNAQNFALVVDRAPQIHPIVANADDHFIQMPSRAWSRALASKSPRESGPKLQHPASDGFVRNVETALREQLLHIAVAQGETQGRAKQNTGSRSADTDGGHTRLEASAEATQPAAGYPHVPVTTPTSSPGMRIISGEVLKYRNGFLIHARLRGEPHQLKLVSPDTAIW